MALVCSCAPDRALLLFAWAGALEASRFLAYAQHKAHASIATQHAYTPGHIISRQYR